MFYSAKVNVLRFLTSITFPFRGEIAGLLVSLLVLLPASASAEEYKLGSLTIDQPWSRATPVGAKVAGGYMVIHNHGQTDDRLIAFSTTIAGKHEVHEMLVRDNVMQMRQLEHGLIIPAGGEVALKPGSYHLMLIDLKQAVTAGETFKATLIFEKAGQIDVVFTVEAMGQTKPHSGGANDHKGH